MIKLIKSTFFEEQQTKEKLSGFILRSKKLSFGSECEKFEKNFSLWQGRKKTIFVNSGSSANLAIIQALLNLGRIKKGDLIGYSAVTWSTNVMPFLQLGLQPIPIDVELETLNISSQNLLRVLKSTPLKMLFLTNLLGFCGDLEKIQEICSQKKIILIEDNCESLGSVYLGKKLGNFGLASTFSFYVGHHLSTIEGGAICTDDEELATMLQIVRAHGWDRNLSFIDQCQLRQEYEINSEFYSRYTFYDLGYNFRPTEINGFLGNLQLKSLNKIVFSREKNFLQLAKVLYQNNKYYPVKFNHLDLVSNFAFPLICKNEKQRDKLAKKCKNKVEIRPIVGGDISSQPFFRKYIFNHNFSTVNARLIHDRGLYFANNPELSQKDLQSLINVFS